MVMRGIAFLLALLALWSYSLAPCQASPVFFVLTDSRPNDSASIRAAVGRVLAYRLVGSGSGPVYQLLTIRDDVTGKKESFVVVPGASVDNRPLKCVFSEAAHNRMEGWALRSVVARAELCYTLPKRIVVGKTRVLLIFWQPREMAGHIAIMPAPVTDTIDVLGEW